jgi:hypothetical protein
MNGVLDAFTRFVRAPPAPTQRLVVANRTRSAPVQRLLEAAFAGQPVEVGDVDLPGRATDVVLLVRDGAVVAASPLEELLDSYLLINSDRYVTGGVGVDDCDLPAVLTRLDETTFEVRGYPATDKGKFLLVAVSRHIEARALAAGDGTLRTTFQDLSRIDDEVGTRRVYRSLAASDLDVHVYGHCGSPPSGLDLTAHVGDHEGYRRAWCVVYAPHRGAGHAALVAVEGAENEWVGRWTFDAASVRWLESVFADEF